LLRTTGSAGGAGVTGITGRTLFAVTGMDILTGQQNSCDD